MLTLFAFKVQLNPNLKDTFPVFQITENYLQLSDNNVMFSSLRRQNMLQQNMLQQSVIDSLKLNSTNINLILDRTTFYGQGRFYTVYPLIIYTTLWLLDVSTDICDIYFFESALQLFKFKVQLNSTWKDIFPGFRITENHLQLSNNNAMFPSLRNQNVLQQSVIDSLNVNSININRFNYATLDRTDFYGQEDSSTLLYDECRERLLYLVISAILSFYYFS